MTLRYVALIKRDDISVTKMYNIFIRRRKSVYGKSTENSWTCKSFFDEKLPSICGLKQKDIDIHSHGFSVKMFKMHQHCFRDRRRSHHVGCYRKNNFLIQGMTTSFIEIDKLSFRCRYCLHGFISREKIFNLK